MSSDKGKDEDPDQRDPLTIAMELYGPFYNVMALVEREPNHIGMAALENLLWNMNEKNKRLDPKGTLQAIYNAHANNVSSSSFFPLDVDLSAIGGGAAGEGGENSFIYEDPTPPPHDSTLEFTDDEVFFNFLPNQQQQHYDYDYDENYIEGAGAFNTPPPRLPRPAIAIFSESPPPSAWDEIDLDAVSVQRPDDDDDDFEEISSEDDDDDVGDPLDLDQYYINPPAPEVDDYIPENYQPAKFPYTTARLNAAYGDLVPIKEAHQALANAQWAEGLNTVHHLPQAFVNEKWNELFGEKAQQQPSKENVFYVGDTGEYIYQGGGGGGGGAAAAAAAAGGVALTAAALSAAYVAYKYLGGKQKIKKAARKFRDLFRKHRKNTNLQRKPPSPSLPSPPSPSPSSSSPGLSAASLGLLEEAEAFEAALALAAVASAPAAAAVAAVTAAVESSSKGAGVDVSAVVGNQNQNHFTPLMVLPDHLGEDDLILMASYDSRKGLQSSLWESKRNKDGIISKRSKYWKHATKDQKWERVSRAKRIQYMARGRRNYKPRMKKMWGKKMSEIKKRRMMMMKSASGATSSGGGSGGVGGVNSQDSRRLNQLIAQKVHYQKDLVKGTIGQALLTSLKR